MKYLFFDIECANSYNGDPKICEFGYVLTDEDFKVLRKEDIPMSPGRGKGTSFDRYIPKADPEFDWAYDISYYYTCPEFDEYYDKIAALLKQEDTMLFGFSVFNDVTFLDAAIARYGLKRFDYRVYDIQRLAQNLLKPKKTPNLEALFTSLLGKGELLHLQPHLSRDDAYMSMRILSWLCQKENATPSELFSRAPHCAFSALEELQKHYDSLKKRQENEANLKEGMRRWEEFCLENENSHPLVHVSKTLKKDLKSLEAIIDACRKLGYGAATSLMQSDIFINGYGSEKIKANAAIKATYPGKIMSCKEFRDLVKKPSSPS